MDQIWRWIYYTKKNRVVAMVCGWERIVSNLKKCMLLLVILPSL